ncbi:MAG: RnfABCDGE type electron transport complex subunit B [Candidatus Omnitrophica bacterium]|nr:RnfABCDGE type electron transport complex subunit B [Candidatus Omnitrophota bacterium]
MDKLVLISILSMSGLGFLFALILVLANKQLKVEEDPGIEKIAGLLPGANCGACGLAGCRAYAEQLIAGTVQAGLCPANGAEEAAQIAGILGVEHKQAQPEYAFIHCGADKSQKTYKADYTGIHDCQAVLLVANGATACKYACLGFGNCVRACPFNAIKMVNGLPVVDYKLCIGCGNCLKACPRDIISLAPLANKRDFCIACSSHDKGGLVKKICPIGCIGCRICEKECPEEAIHMEDNLAVIDYNKCIGCGICAKKCPQKTILKIN